jgi:hypothetical protein
MRLRLAQTSLTGSSSAPVLVTVTPAIDWAHAHVNPMQKQALENSLSDLLRAHPRIGDQVGALARAAAR